MSNKKNVNIIYKWISFGLAMILLTSTIITGTLAWNDFTKFSLSRLSGGSDQYAVILNKYEKGTNDTVAVKGAQFLLYRVVGNAVDEQKNGLYYTDSDGKIRVEELEPGNYYFLETSPTYAYNYDTKDGKRQNKYEFVISDDHVNDNNEATVTAYNQRRIANLTITKTIQSANGLALTQTQQTTPFEFKVTFGDKNTYEYRIGEGEKIPIKSGDTINLMHGQTATIENIPVGTTYNVIELPVEGYQISSTNHSGSIPVEGITAQFLNTCASAILPMGTLTISKEVLGDAASEKQLFNFTVAFSENGTYTYWIEEEEKTITNGGTIALSHGQSAVFTDLPVGLTYTVTEDDYTSEDYISSIENITGTITESRNIVECKNYKSTESDKTGSLSVSKQVTGMSIEPEAEFEFTIEFKEINAGAIIEADTYQYQINCGEALTLPQDGKLLLKHGETAVFGGIPVNVKYTVEESDYSADGYTAKVKSVSGAVIEGNMTKADFNNERKLPEQAELRIKKIVTGTTTDQAFTFHLMINNETTTFELKHDEEKVISLPYGAIYQVTEEDCFEDAFIQTALKNGYGTAAGTIIVEQMNTFVGNNFTDIDGVKLWDMSAKPEEQLPESIVVYLKDGDVVVDTQIVTADGDGNWNYSFKAPLADTEGQIIDYTVEEMAIPNYKATVTKSEAGFEIINTYSEEIAMEGMTSIKVTKLWVNSENDKNHLENVQVQLYKEGEAFGNPVILKSDNDWTYVWNELDKTFNWTVDELNVPANYTKTISGDAENGYIITNTYTTKVSTEKPTANSKSQSGTIAGPKTGDNSNTWLWLAVMAASTVGIGIMVVCKKKAKKEQEQEN